MKPTKYMVALAVAALISACGGGSEPAPVTPQLAMQAVKAHAAVIRKQQPNKTTEEYAEDLMAFAEENFPQYFPPGPATSTLAPFQYRYYSQTNSYLGVTMFAAGPFAGESVYIVGDPFGNSLANPINVGPMSKFIDTTGGNNGGNNGGGGGGTGNGCFDLALHDTQGATININYAYSGSITGTVQENTTIGAMTTFESQSARAINVNITGSAGAANLTTSGTAYTLKVNDTTVRRFGSEFSSQSAAGPFTLTTNIKTVNSPPTDDASSGLALGQSLVVTDKGSATTTMSGMQGLPGPTTTNFDTSTTVTYVLREQVAVNAGTYEACKYTSQVGQNPVVTTWFQVGTGVPLKIVSQDLTIQANSFTVTRP